ncbi:phosphate ABC transporter substrate-binding protein PstS [Rhodoplanes sp. TEM]|uniref:Phosphate-binding protein PstS n=1 Tax=Rhodoplanes tepidamans TaxID=200616 RepID=A0ABT5JH91_RHOTP|nr:MULTISPECIES: phosphate ABC transporter substrate-binding protein PstS [Rhodoplanes]MDC7788952.1 phosphate ABC transporter substrate-binding protein PstS [Rhodoplanes tepidamans]MDC7987670.1 phosphate ABC transporter substrate-binding protein PstS [Rhodoplanes sp. TEM]MDQ0358646.1 phosphate transport system substrate-binding protein [Rhodoplanes tepidamans]
MGASRRTMIVAAAVGMAVAVAPAAGLAQQSATGSSGPAVAGAGATFPAPLYERWIAAYKAERGAAVTYQSVGSGEGVKRFLAGTVDFGASDEVLSAADAAKVPGGAVAVPVTAGMIVLAYNLPGLGGALKLPRDVYVGIFAGTVTRWDDPRIKAANPDLKLPPRDIALVTRRDSSGTTAAFTRHLAAADPAWRSAGLVAGKMVSWPGRAMLAAGNEGVAARIKMSEGSIGYVEYGFAKRLGLPVAALQNRSGSVVAPSAEAAQLALSARSGQTGELEASVVDPTAANAYPIVSYSWLFLYREPRDAAKGRAARDFVAWGLGQQGQALARELGYVPLTADIVSLGRDALGALSQ